MKSKKQFLAITLLFLFSTEVLFAQSDQQELIPFNQDVRVGTLDNGLKYFIKKNKKPEDRVEFRLAVNAGSVLEDDDQLGLAHFTEHMAFNGSEHFEKNELVDYLQSVGVKFGAHLNAYTSFDETVYILPVPSDKEEILDKSLTILRDWAGGLSFDQKELDKERGVVIEEWRLGQGAQMRMLQEYLPIIFKGSKYAERLPIGTKDILENFDVQTIKRFYEDWYRPDLMAVIAVGDIDVDAMEAKIKAQFSDLKNPSSPRKREEFDLPDNQDPLAAVTSDPEATNFVFNIMYKTEAGEFKTKEQYRRMLINRLFISMINQRLSDLTQLANPPYLYATTYLGSPVSRKKTAFSAVSIPKPDDIEGGVKGLLTELRRLQLHGFNSSELKTAKLNMHQGYEDAYKERDKTPSKPLADELIRHFLEEEPVPGIVYEFGFVKEVLPGISIDEINEVVQEMIKKENRVVLMTAPEIEGVTLPSDENLLTWIHEIELMDFDPLEEVVVDENLIKKDITPGSVVSSEKVAEVGVEKIVLSNGATIFLKETDFKDDEVVFSAHRSGGVSAVEDDKYWSASMTTEVIVNSGIGDYSYTDLQKALAGKSASVTPYMNSLSSGFRGNASPDDIETMLQLVYLYCSEVRRDEDAYQSIQKRNEAALSNLLSDPRYYYQDKLARIMSQNHLRGNGIPSVEDLKKADLEEIHQIFKEHFSSTGDFTYWFVGNFKKEKILPFITKYLGAQPAQKNEISWVDRGMRAPSGIVEESIFKGTEEKSTVTLKYTGEVKHNKKDAYYLRCLGEVLSIQLIEKLREEKGGVYGVGANAGMSKKPYSKYSLTVKFPCGPENVEELLKSAKELISDVKEQGIEEEYLTKIKETQKRDVEIQFKSNIHWIRSLENFYKDGKDIKKLNEKNLVARIDKLNSKSIRKAAKKYIKEDQYIQVVLYPEKK